MNGRQRAVAIIALAVVVTLFLFPPWYRTSHGRTGEITIYRGFHWLMSPANRPSHIDFASLLWLLGGVSVMALLALLELKDAPPDRRVPF